MRKVISKDGTPIAFDQSGQGPVLILVAGATSTRLAEAELAAALAPISRCVPTIGVAEVTVEIQRHMRSSARLRILMP